MWSYNRTHMKSRASIASSRASFSSTAKLPNQTLPPTNNKPLKKKYEFIDELLVKSLKQTVKECVLSSPVVQRVSVDGLYVPYRKLNVKVHPEMIRFPKFSADTHVCVPIKWPKKSTLRNSTICQYNIRGKFIVRGKDKRAKAKDVPLTSRRVRELEGEKCLLMPLESERVIDKYRSEVEESVHRAEKHLGSESIKKLYQLY
eukprot:TRINITY_DN12189_c0_g2_i2.p1 TRINITY_DN12189_c0_g2~~TRINITY_DN12189_c0_g2_i2.p1  ORF type:complete len:202 (-),score=53.00 TRINITY_DN12189_c0_g2_i2:125-730(-)